MKRSRDTSAQIGLSLLLLSQAVCVHRATAQFVEISAEIELTVGNRARCVLDYVKFIAAMLPCFLPPIIRLGIQIARE
jgi:hypothetical protein